MISSNQFTKKSFNKVSVTWSNAARTSSNGFNRQTYKKGMDIWQGDNTSEGAFGAQDMFGGVNSTFGDSPYESQAHFKLRTNYDVTH